MYVSDFSMAGLFVEGERCGRVHMHLWSFWPSFRQHMDIYHSETRTTKASSVADPEPDPKLLAGSGSNPDPK